METLKALKGPFDLCFIDADKGSYNDYYERAIGLVRQGGLIVLDNMLRGGRVLSPRDQDARTVAALNDRIQKDERVENVLLPIRDGVMLAYRR
jgi:predicted O-methyltransferase YrrM